MADDLLKAPDLTNLVNPQIDTSELTMRLNEQFSLLVDALDPLGVDIPPLDLARALQVGYDSEGLSQYLTEVTQDVSQLASSISIILDAITGGSSDPLSQAQFDLFFSQKTTSDLAEGSNLYYTDTRFNTAFAAKDTDDLSEGTTNKYFTTANFDSELATKTTDDITEGATNLYNVIPAGGTAGQVPEKIDGTDYNIQWVTPVGGGTKAYAQTISTAAITVATEITNWNQAGGAQERNSGDFTIGTSGITAGKAMEVEIEASARVAISGARTVPEVRIYINGSPLTYQHVNAAYHRASGATAAADHFYSGARVQLALALNDVVSFEVRIDPDNGNGGSTITSTDHVMLSIAEI